MAGGNAVWGIEIGQCGLKAVKLRPADEGKVELAAFDLIDHPKVLSQPDADPDEISKAALEKFVSRNDWQGDRFVIGVPGQNTFARFCKLPPVEAKKIPDIVRFEASQQIPFDMDDVVWDYQVFADEDSPDIEVGIFAMRKDLIRSHLEFFENVGITPTTIQTVPSALYNFCRFDVGEGIGEGSATVVIDVGAQNTDLVVVEQNSAWTRNIPLGGNAFTEALVKAFKLSFAKAESLKKTAATSKYARQIFQAMRPIFSDLVAEIQRSLGFYGQTHRDVELKKVLACGSAFRLPGLQKYLENNLTIGDVAKLDHFDKLVTTQTSNAPQFADNILGFAASYGLALQGLGEAAIGANLLPPDLARVQLWNKKRPYFAAAAACLGLAATFPWIRTSIDSSALGDTPELTQAKQIVNTAKRYQADYNKVSKNTDAERAKIDKLFELQKDRDLVPRVLALVHEALPPIDPMLEKVKTPDELKKLVKSNPARFARNRRGQLIIESLSVQYSKDIDKLERNRSQRGSGNTGTSMGGRGGMSGAAFGGPGGETGGFSSGGGGGGEGGDEGGEGAPGFFVELSCRLLYGESQPQAATFVTEKFLPKLQALGMRPHAGFWIPAEDKQALRDDKNLDLFRIWQARATNQTIAIVDPIVPAADDKEAAALIPDPVTGEETANDWLFELSFKVKLGDPPAPEEKKQEGNG